ncbi:MAG: hypothetical protein QOF95_2069, partial [Pseudonocardiales bacterium]|nr:hypothetical protein [Pseudonocardiales bacterium]
PAPITAQNIVENTGETNALHA